MSEKKRKKDVRKIGKKMDKSKAKKWVKRYQKKNPDATHGWLYGRDIIETLCNYDSLEGIWFFKGINGKGDERLILFPADKEGNILDNQLRSLGAAAAKTMGGSGEDDPVDDGQMCPPECPNLGGG